MEKDKSQHHQNPTNEDFTHKHYELSFHIGKNIRYHSKRSAFFTFWSNTTKILSYLIGSATIVAILSEQYQFYAVICNLIVLILNAFDSFIGFGDKARDYGEFYKAYKTLEMPLRKAKNENELNEIWEKVDQIELNEPNILNVLMAICWNEEYLYRGGNINEMVKINCCQSLFAQFIDISSSKLAPNYTNLSMGSE